MHACICIRNTHAHAHASCPPQLQKREKLRGKEAAGLREKVAALERKLEELPQVGCGTNRQRRNVHMGACLSLSPLCHYLRLGCLSLSDCLRAPSRAGMHGRRRRRLLASHPRPPARVSHVRCALAHPPLLFTTTTLCVCPRWHVAGWLAGWNVAGGRSIGRRRLCRGRWRR